MKPFSFSQKLLSLVLCLALAAGHFAAPGQQRAKTKNPAAGFSCLAVPLDADRVLVEETADGKNPGKAFFTPSRVVPALFLAAAAALVFGVSPALAAAHVGGTQHSPPHAALWLARSLAGAGVLSAARLVYGCLRHARIRGWKNFVNLGIVMLIVIVPLLSACSGQTSTGTAAPFETPISTEAQAALAENYSIPGLDRIDATGTEKHPYNRFWSRPENVEDSVNAAYFFNVPLVYVWTILPTEIMAVGSEGRQEKEALVRDIHPTDYNSTGIAEIQVRRATGLLPRLFSALAAAPAGQNSDVYRTLTNAQALYSARLGGRNIFDPAVIGERDEDGKLAHYDIIVEILNSDEVGIYLCTLYLREAMEMLHAADPARFPDPDGFNHRSLDMPYSYVGALEVYYVEGPDYALNPETRDSVWSAVADLSEVPDFNIYKLNVRVMDANFMNPDWIPVVDYLLNPAAYLNLDAEAMVFSAQYNLDIDTFGEVMHYMPDYWDRYHAVPYDEGLFGLWDNDDVILAQAYGPQAALMQWMYTHSAVYGLMDAWRYPVSFGRNAAVPTVAATQEPADAPAAGTPEAVTPGGLVASGPVGVLNADGGLTYYEEAGGQAGRPVIEGATYMGRKLPANCVKLGGAGEAYFYIVQPGDTFSGIAEELQPFFYPDLPLADAYNRMVEYNGFFGFVRDLNSLAPGDMILINNYDPDDGQSFNPSLVPIAAGAVPVAAKVLGRGRALIFGMRSPEVPEGAKSLMRSA